MAHPNTVKIIYAPNRLSGGPKYSFEYYWPQIIVVVVFFHKAENGFGRFTHAWRVFLKGGCTRRLKTYGIGSSQRNTQLVFG